jgi:hypothetical protein
MPRPRVAGRGGTRPVVVPGEPGAEHVPDGADGVDPRSDSPEVPLSRAGIRCPVRSPAALPRAGTNRPPMLAWRSFHCEDMIRCWLASPAEVRAKSPCANAALLHDQRVGGLRFDVRGQGGAGGVQPEPQRLRFEGGVVEVDAVPLQRLGLPGEPGAERLQRLGGVGVVERREVGGEPDHRRAHVADSSAVSPMERRRFPKVPAASRACPRVCPNAVEALAAKSRTSCAESPKTTPTLEVDSDRSRRLGDGLLEELADLLGGERGGEQPGGALGDPGQRAEDPRLGLGLEAAGVGAEPDGGLTEDRDGHPAPPPSPGRGLRGFHGCLLVR